MKHTFTDPDLIELDRIWPLGQLLDVPDYGTIVVAGAYEGRYLHYFNERFPTAFLNGFEPQPEAYMKAKARLGNRAVLFSKGLATTTRIARVGNYGSDGCSMLATEGERNILNMLDAAEALSVGIGRSIDLLVLNMEGYEWALIPYLLDEMMHHHIASIALQQHTKYASKERIARVKAYLAEYYDLIYTDGQLDGWEYWRRKHTL